MEFQAVVNRAVAIRELYIAFEQRKYGNPWSNEEILLGFVGDVGDLAKLVVAQNDSRDIPDNRQKLEHELADCLCLSWSWQIYTVLLWKNHFLKQWTIWRDTYPNEINLPSPC